MRYSGVEVGTALANLLQNSRQDPTITLVLRSEGKVQKFQRFKLNTRSWWVIPGLHRISFRIQKGTQIKDFIWERGYLNTDKEEILHIEIIHS